MTGMDDREKAFESKFALDQELKFKAEARRNKLLGLWAAGLIGRKDAEAYARDVVASDFMEAGDEDVFRKVRADFEEAGVTIPETDIRAKMTELLAVAFEQLQND